MRRSPALAKWNIAAALAGARLASQANAELLIAQRKAESDACEIWSSIRVELQIMEAYV